MSRNQNLTMKCLSLWGPSNRVPNCPGSAWIVQFLGYFKKNPVLGPPLSFSENKNL